MSGQNWLNVKLNWLLAITIQGFVYLSMTINISPPNLAVNKLGLRRSERWLFRNLSFELAPGEILQVVGKNGAGKTSLLRSVCGFLPQAEGRISWGQINGQLILPMFLGHLAGVKPELSVLENLEYHPIAGQFPENDDIESAIAALNLSHYTDTPARQLSAGQIRRVSLARLILAKTRCWVLDEPFTSLDVDGCDWLELKIAEFAGGGGSVLLTSHQPINISVAPRILAISQLEPMHVD